MKTLLAFDLDGTLAESKSPIDDEMAGLLSKLLAVVKVAIISGGAWPQFQKQVIERLPQGSDFSKLSILPTNGTRFMQYRDGAWQTLYAEDFTDAQKHEIESALQDAVKQAGVVVDKIWGEQIEDRGSQITFSALGQEAPLDAKKTWDPDFAKRQQIKAILDRTLPEFSVSLGGTTSVDVTMRGIDKAYGIRKLRDVLHIPIDQMLYAGDALFPGGNDYPVRTTGADCVQVRDPEETKRVIETATDCLK